jgi:hypothetical protein
VVELATRYLRERRIDARRLFTVSALDYLDATLAGRAASAWNEFRALRDTLEAHAEEHMLRLAERERRNAELAEVRNSGAKSVDSRPSLRRVLERFLRQK